MTYPYGNPDAHSGRMSSPHSGYASPLTDTAEGRTLRDTYLLCAVLVLGLATYLVSFGGGVQTGGTSWEIRFSVLAAVVAGLGLLPRQMPYTKLIAALAIAGALEALARWITASDQTQGWPTIVIVVLNGLQAFVAIAALLANIGTLGASDRQPGTYDPYAAYYAYYAQAAWQNYPRQRPDEVPRSGTGQAEAAVTAQEQRDAAASYEQYADYTAWEQGHATPPASPRTAGAPGHAAYPAATPGLPNTGQAANPSQRHDTTGQSPTQASSP
jgi:Family of unknown function (DUF5336)